MTIEIKEYKYDKKSAQINTETINKLNKLKDKLQLHNISEVIEYLLKSNSENKTLKQTVETLVKRLDNLEEQLTNLIKQVNKGK